MRAACGVGVSDRGEYQGSGVGLVDDKGRVAIPSSLRSTLAGNAPRADGKDGGTVIIGPHQKQRCLIAYDAGYLAKLKAQLDTREERYTGEDGEFDYNIKRRAASGEAVPFDGSGRLIMPGFPRAYAGITQHAFFFGVFDYFEIWDPSVLFESDGPENMKFEARWHLEQKGVTQ